MPYAIPPPTRRQAILGLSATATALSAPAVASETWPNRPVRIILPYAPGGATDFIGRPWAERLSQAFGQPFIIDNRGGASGAIGTEAVARSAGDGYTFLLTPNSALNILPQLRRVNFDPRKDFVPVARVGDLVCGFVILSRFGLATMPDVIAHAKANPGKLVYGAAGPGTSAQLRIEMLKLRAGVDILYVPYRGSGDAVNDLLAEQIHMMNEIVVLPHVRSGRLKLLVMNHPTRHPEFPDVPTMTEIGFPSADVPIWFSVWAPAGTPKEIIETFNHKAAQIAATPEMIQRMRDLSVGLTVQAPDQIAAFFEQDAQANAKLIKEANIKLE